MYQRLAHLHYAWAIGLQLARPTCYPHISCHMVVSSVKLTDTERMTLAMQGVHFVTQSGAGWHVSLASTMNAM